MQRTKCGFCVDGVIYRRRFSTLGGFQHSEIVTEMDCPYCLGTGLAPQLQEEETE